MFREAFPEYADVSDSDLWGQWLKPIRSRGLGFERKRMAPPAYFGAGPAWRTIHALTTWLAEPAEC